MPEEGFEPSRPEGQRILSPVRLPFRHPGFRHYILPLIRPVNRPSTTTSITLFTKVSVMTLSTKVSVMTLPATTPSATSGFDSVSIIYSITYFLTFVKPSYKTLRFSLNAPQNIIKQTLIKKIFNGKKYYVIRSKLRR